jgi:hypothetical protein
MIDNLPFKRMYAPTHTNMICYLIGLWAGFLLYKIRPPARPTLHKFFFVMVTLTGFGVIMSGYMFYEYDFEKPSLWCACYAALQKSFFGQGLVYLMWCFSNKIDSEFCMRQIRRFRL